MGGWHGIVTLMYTEQAYPPPQAIFYVSTMLAGLLPRSLTLPKSFRRLGGELCIPHACNALHTMLARMIPYTEAQIYSLSLPVS